MDSLKSKLKKTWFGKLLKRLLKGSNSNRNYFKDSKSYWENRYKSMDNSGPGSYGRLADFKAKTLNNFVENYNIRNVIELGVGDGNQLSLANYPQFTGFDVSETAIELCKNRFAHDRTKQFFMMDDPARENEKAELVLSLDVLYHLVEDDVYNKYMRRLFNSSIKFVIIYSSNYEEHTVSHVRSRKFTNWIDANVSNQWSLMEVIKNPYPYQSTDPDNTSMADFYIYMRS